MAKRSYQVRDFRSHRRLLSPDSFALGGDLPNSPPIDRISKKAWRTLMSLPDDVSIRTSNDHGALIEELEKMHWALLEITEPPLDRLKEVLLDIQDDLGAANVSALQGFYRQAIASLRTALELSVISCDCETRRAWEDFDGWASGSNMLTFGGACDRLGRIELVRWLEDCLKSQDRDAIFAARSRTAAGGWARRLYAELCNFAQSRPGYSNADQWASNGPVYERTAFLRYARLFTETYALIVLITRIAFGAASLPSSLPLMLSAKRRWAVTARLAHKCFTSAATIAAPK